MRVTTIIHSAAGPNPAPLRILREETDCIPPEVPGAQAAPVVVPKSASTA